MPTSGSHTTQARHNIDFMNKINNDPNINNIFLDWIATTIFYTALHYNDGFFHTFLNLHPSDHGQRIDILSREVRKGKYFSKKYFESYKRLMNDSEMARYQPDLWKSIINRSRISVYIKDLDIIKNRR